MNREQIRERIFAQLRTSGCDWPVLEIKRLEAESAGRLRELNRKAEEARTEWKRAEAAEAKLAAIKGVTVYPEDDVESLMQPDSREQGAVLWVKWSDIRAILGSTL